MSMHAQLNINEKTMADYSPLDQLSEKYRKQIINQSRVIIFDEGETLFEKQHELTASYYLLAGKLSAKRGILMSTTLDSSQKDCRNPINDRIPDGVSVKAQTSGHMLLVDPRQLDRALALSESEAQERSKQISKEDAKPASATEPPQEFDEEYFNWMTSLLEFPLFLNLPPANIQAIFDRFEKVEVAAGDEIIREGELGDYFYLLIRGRAKVLVGPSRAAVATLRPGAYFGEEALVSDTERSASVVMDTDGCLARLDKEAFQSLLHDSLVKSISYADYKKMLAAREVEAELLDIRSASEFEHIPLPDCLHIPLSDLRNNISSLDRQKTYFLTEEGGQRNDIAAHILAQNRLNVFVIRES
ncbi:MAG: cyclic nucleotide-binding domain-containing protein [Hahellaceae bacterium]|nr:cyclic nucleotide-binding domain-containing protein [Hahellaceae bacterium]MCP5169740.1 cyclic nucleotide-binding domain-containing protein [Hahellaceae bacterium]